MTQEFMVAFTCTETAVQHRGIAQVIFGVDRTEGVLGARLAPGLRIIAAHIAGTRYWGGGRHLHTLLRRIGVAFGVADIGRKAQALAPEIQAQHGHFAVDALMIPFGIAGLLHAVEANAELIVFAKAPAHVHRAAGLTVGGPGAGERVDVLVGGALGHHVDPAAHAATGRDAVDQLGGAFEDVDAVGHFHVDGVSRQHAV